MSTRPVRRRARVLVPVAVSVVVLAVLFLGVFPTRAFLSQRAAIAAATEELRGIESVNAELQARVEALGSDAEVERLAREQYNLVFPGEDAYALLPAPPPTVPVPDAWPFRGLASAGDVDPREPGGAG